MLMRPRLIDPMTPLPLQQSDVFADALRHLHRQANVENLNNTGQAVVVERKFGLGIGLRFTSRGPIWCHDTTLQDRVDALRRSRINLVNANADDAHVLRSAGYRQIMTPMTNATLSLHANPEKQMAQAHQKWRNAARQLDRRGLQIKTPDIRPDRLEWLLSAEKLQQKRKRYRALPDDVTRALVAASAGDALLFTANKGNAIHAAMLILRHGTQATYHIGWSDAVGRGACAHHAMILHAAGWLTRHGVTHLDLGQIDTQNAPGLARFKIGSGATIMQLGGTWLRLTAWRK